MYRFNRQDGYVIRIADGATVPMGHETYVAWLAEGNRPLPAPDLTDEEIRQEFKIERARVVAAIKVTSSLGRTFDGAEIDTDRMLKPITVLKEKPEGTTWLWVLADNTAVQVALPEFLEVLELAGREQTRLWVAPNE